MIAIGTDFDGMMTQGWKQPQPPHLIAINVDAADASKNYLPDVLIEADAAAGVERARGARPGARRPGRARRAGARAERGRCAPSWPRPTPRRSASSRRSSARCPTTACVICDMCIPGYWLGGFHRTPAAAQARLPARLGHARLRASRRALGAALAGAGPVVSISGDGGFLYACGELATLAQERIPLTAVIVDDGGYGMLRFDQDLKGDPREGVDLHTPDFVALARSFGVRADEVDGLGERFEAHARPPLRLDEPTRARGEGGAAPAAERLAPLVSQ